MVEDLAIPNKFLVNLQTFNQKSWLDYRMYFQSVLGKRWTRGSSCSGLPCPLNHVRLLSNFQAPFSVVLSGFIYEQGIRCGWLQIWGGSWLCRTTRLMKINSLTARVSWFQLSFPEELEDVGSSSDSESSSSEDAPEAENMEEWRPWKKAFFRCLWLGVFWRYNLGHLIGLTCTSK